MFLLLNESPNMRSWGAIELPGLEKVLLDRDVVPVAGCVLVVLLMLICVIRWMARSSLLRRVAQADETFLTAFRNSAHALALFQNGESVEGSPRSVLYTNACREIAFHLLGSDVVDKGFALRLRAAGRITPSQWASALRAARRSAEESARWMRAGLTGSGLTGSGVRALLGLGVLGSMLGIMEHLGAGTLDAAAVGSCLRPFGLALCFHVIGTAWQRRVERRAAETAADLDDFCTELGTLFDRSFVDHRQPIDSLPSLGGMGLADGPTFNLPPSEPARRAAS